MKKLNKFFAILVSLAMMATLCVCMAFAEDEEPAPAAPLTKTLNVPNGTAIPDDAAAHFDFTFLAQNGVAPQDADADYLIEDVDLALDSATGRTMTTDADANVDTYTYDMGNVLDGINWPAAGWYEWLVEEDEFTADDANDDTEDHLNQDDAVYKLVVKVVYNEDGELVVDEVIIKSGTDNPDPNDDDDWTAAEGLAFENDYYTTTGNDTIDPDDPEDPDDPVDPGDEDEDNAGLSVEKLVAGEFGDTSDQGEDGFQITVNLALPQIGGADTATAVIRKANGDLQNVTITNGANVVALSHGDKLVFTEIAEGTKYTVVETDARNDASLTEGYTATGEVTTATAVVKGTNEATITNTSNQDEETPTGILINNLPYIVLALVAIGGLCAYVIVRRKADDEA